MSTSFEIEFAHKRSEFSQRWSSNWQRWHRDRLEKFNQDMELLRMTHEEHLMRDFMIIEDIEKDIYTNLCDLNHSELTKRELKEHPPWYNEKMVSEYARFVTAPLSQNSGYDL